MQYAGVLTMPSRGEGGARRGLKGAKEGGSAASCANHRSLASASIYVYSRK